MESNLTSKSQLPGRKAYSLALGLDSTEINTLCCRCALFINQLTQIHQWAGYQALLDEGVQGRVEFGVRGHRLNDSKTEEAVVVYCKDIGRSLHLC